MILLKLTSFAQIAYRKRTTAWHNPEPVVV